MTAAVRADPVSATRRTVSGEPTVGYHDAAPALQRNLARLLFCALVADHWRRALDPPADAQVIYALAWVATSLRAEADALAAGLRAAGAVPDARPATLAALEQVHHVPIGPRDADRIVRSGESFLSAVSSWAHRDAVEVRRSGHDLAATLIEQGARTLAREGSDLSSTGPSPHSPDATPSTEAGSG